MKINKIYIKNFRNIKEAELSFSDKCNIFFGNNAEGKTNMLEAISLCIGKSFRIAKVQSFIPFGLQEDTLIRLWYNADNREEKENLIEYRISNGRPDIKVNGFSQKSAMDLYGEIKYVVFIPEHVALIKGKPQGRREYTDNIVMLQNKAHRKIINAYKDALNQRTALNYNFTGYSHIDQIQSVWNDILAKQGTNLTFGRIKYLSLIKEYALKLYKEISDEKEELDLYYYSSVFGRINSLLSFDFDNKQYLYNTYIEKIKLTEDNNRIIAGAHRDDIIFEINGKNVREFGSQGQLRSIALILKLSESLMIKEYNRETPVLLLDEILSELDEKRRSYIVNHFEGAQVFITSCNLNDFIKKENEEQQENISAKIWEVKGGKFEIYSYGK